MNQRLLKAEDLYKMKFPGHPALSPDGSRVVYVVTAANVEKNGYSSSLYIAGTDVTDGPRKFTAPYHSEKLVKDQAPAWSPDGTALAFLSNRTEKQQVWMIAADGGEARALTDEKEGVTAFRWSPDSKSIVYTAKDETDEVVEEEYTVVTRLRYKGDGVGYHHTWQQIGLLNIETGESLRLTEGEYDHHSPRFSADGSKIYYLASKNDDRELSDLDNLYHYDLTSGEESLMLKGEGPIAAPAVSPDGRWLAYAGHTEGEISSANTWLWLLSLENGEVRNLTADFDRPVGNYVIGDTNLDDGGDILQWADDSRSILFLATEGGDCAIKRVSLEGEVTDEAGQKPGVATSFDSNSYGLVYFQAAPDSIGDLFCKNGEEAPVRLTTLNQELFEELKLPVPESFTFKSVDDWEIDGWYLQPADVKEGEKHPVVLEIHGGPHMAYGNAFFHEFQLLAAKGYGVVYTNPRGSQGYGDEFVKACVADWGGKDREDIMNGLDYVLERHPECDRDDVHVTGGSYGGFMTNMIVTQTSRFRSAVTQRCISNIYSFLGTSDIGFFFGSDQLGGADQWEDEETFMKFSPIRYARRVTTPTCVIHSEEDLRCPIEQGEQWFTALKRLGVDTRFVRFNGESHNLSRSGRPKNRMRRLEEIGGWFDQYRDQNE